MAFHKFSQTTPPSLCESDHAALALRYANDKGIRGPDRDARRAVHLDAAAPAHFASGQRVSTLAPGNPPPVGE